MAKIGYIRKPDGQNRNRHAHASSRHRGTRRVIFAVDVVVRAAERFNVVVHFVCDAPIINTSYQKLPFGSGDHPDRLLFHQALN